jgi:polar amino acid transport system substrate-binding protein
MKKLSVVTIVLFFLISLATAAWAGSALKRIKSTGVLTVGSTVTGVPATFMDPHSGKIVGIMVDVAQGIANSLGVKLKVVETAWSALIPSLQTHKIDLIAAAMLITPKREKVIDFSEPVYPYCEALIVKATDTKPYKNIQELKGLRMGGQVGTIYVKGMEDRGIKDVKVYNNIGDILMDISDGRLDGAIVDGPVARWLVKTKPQFKVRVVKTYVPVMCGHIGIGVNKQDKDLLAAVNKAIAKMKKDGKIQQILQKWGQ